MLKCSITYHTSRKILEITVYRTYKILPGKPSFFAGKLFTYFNLCDLSQTSQVKQESSIEDQTELNNHTTECVNS
jgi:hypothetical protein